MIDRPERETQILQHHLIEDSWIVSVFSVTELHKLIEVRLGNKTNPPLHRILIGDTEYQPCKVPSAESILAAARAEYGRI